MTRTCRTTTLGGLFPAADAAPDSAPQVQVPAPPPSAAAPAAGPRTLEDLFRCEIPDEPWQHERYSGDNRTWQAAAMRKRSRFRRTGVSLGVCTVDLSGPHEPTPRPGNRICRDMASYFLVQTVKPELSQDITGVEAQTQTDSPDVAAPEAPVHAPASAPAHEESSQRPSSTPPF